MAMTGQGRLLGLATAALLLAMAGCSRGSGDGGGNPPSPPPPPGSSGLDGRPANPDCVAPPRPEPDALVRPVRVYSNLTFAAPLAMVKPPGSTSHWYLIERAGVVRRFADTAGVASSSVVLDISGRVAANGEGGLLGIAFHPDFAANGQLYLSYTAGSPFRSVVARFTSNDGGLTFGSEEELLTVNQPFTNHNGGQIAFGPDRYLYIGLGDGGGANDPLGSGQDTTTLLGAMLRIDVDGGAAYAIPADNPFASNAASPCGLDGTGPVSCPEIYAYGLRNPWRWSFDADTGTLWLGDVGQDAIEEIDIIENGGNYGWPIREGTLCNQSGGCPTAGLIEPVAQYDHSQGRSITAGYVYRGSLIPGLAGRLVYGDFVSGTIWGLFAGGGGYLAQPLATSNRSIGSFAQDEDGEIYLLDISDGGIYQLRDAGGAGATVPSDLAATGCVDPADPSRPPAGLIPYDINAPFWSDGADKERWVGVPDGATVTVGADGDFDFPPGSVLMKHFRLAGQLIETRLFMRHPDGVWAGYTYAWNDAGTAASLVEGGLVRDVGGQLWIYPSGSECLVCHSAAAGRSLGLDVAQLNRDFTYPSTGRTDNQLHTWDAIVMFASPLGDPDGLPALAAPDDPQQPREARARAYLHSNCAGCHRSGGPTPVSLDLRHDVALRDTNACDSVPQASALGISDARIIAPGDAARSVLIERIRRRDAHGMPPLASHVVDAGGVALLSMWIDGLGGC